MDGEPYISDSGQFVMEVSAIASYIDGVSAWYDDKVEVFRIETKRIKDCRQKSPTVFFNHYHYCYSSLIFCGRL